MSKYLCLVSVSQKNEMRRESEDDHLVGEHPVEVDAETEEQAKDIAEQKIFAQYGKHPDQMIMLRWETSVRKK